MPSQNDIFRAFDDLRRDVKNDLSAFRDEFGKVLAGYAPNGEIRRLDADLADMKSRVIRLEDDMTKLNNGLSDIRVTIAGISTQLTTIAAQIGNMTTQSQTAAQTRRQQLFQVTTMIAGWLVALLYFILSHVPLH